MLRDGVGVARGRGRGVAEPLIDAREPVRAFAALERAGPLRELGKLGARGVVLVEEVVRHREEPQRIVDPLAARVARERILERLHRVAVVAAVELEPTRQELRLGAPRRARIRRDHLVVPGDRVVVAIDARQRARAVEHRLGRLIAELGIHREQQLAGVVVAPSHVEQRRARPVIALRAQRVGDRIGYERELGDRLVPQVLRGEVLRAFDAIGG
jgi:hypothetical protein